MDAYRKIEYLIAKEARQKRIAMITTVIFVAAALAIVLLSLKVSRLRGELAQKDRLNKLLMDSISQNRGIIHPLPQAGKITEDTAVAMLDTAMSLLPADNPGVEKAPAYTVYIQYAPDMQAQQQQLREVLAKDYKVPPAERITDISFGPTIRYFHPEDAAAAGQLADIAGKSCGLRFDPKLIPIKAPPGQLEVWIGK